MSVADKIEKLVESERVLSMDDCKLCFAVPGADNIIDIIHPITGRSVYENETLDQIRARHPGAEAISLEDFCKAKAARQDGPITWDKISMEQYEEWLCCLPPAAYGNNGFLLGEPWDHHATSGQPRYQACIIKDGFHWASNRPMTRKEFLAI